MESSPITAQLMKFLMPYLVALLKVVIVFHVILGICAFLTLFERKILGRMQIRYGPMRVGWHGILQPLADAVKLMGKEFVVPAQADRPVFLLAPVIALVFAAIPLAVIPWGPEPVYNIIDINIGLIYMLAASSLGGFGIIMAGWSSNSKYSLLGALRAIAQTISYELPLILALVGPLMLAGSLSMGKMVHSQAQMGSWFLFLQPIGFVCYLLAGTAETQRIPFDMLEDEGALVTGFYTEYSGMAFSVFALAEYINIVLIGIVSAVAFMGGWLRPFPSVEALAFLDIVPPFVWLLAKAMFFVFLVIWLRATLPRVRYDQLMYFGWKVLLPLTLLNILLTGLYKMFQLNGGLLIVYYGLTFIFTVGCLAFCTKRFYEWA
jgi:NADH-quinone oxidoreductase subunit H